MRAWELNEEVTRKIKTPEFEALMTPELKKVGSLYKTNGYDLRIVGGAVRDLMLGKTPKDIDLASDATPVQSIAMLMDIKIETIQHLFDVLLPAPNELQEAIANLDSRTGIRVVLTGVGHGTITAFVDRDDKEGFEITTLRIDTEHTGRHAEVEYTKDWEVDAERRDLTFNAMSLDLDGTLYDYFGGIEDLKAGIAKFVGDGDKRMQEDYLRILRYFRFQGRTAKPNFDKDTLEAIKRNAEGLQQISGERIWMEMGKILSGNHVMAILDKITATGVGSQIGLPEYDPAIVERTRKNTDNHVVVLASMMQNDAQAVDLAAKWKMKSYDKELMRFIVINKDDRFTEKEAKEMWTNTKIKNEYVVELARYFGKDDLISELQNWETPTFPINGRMLLDVGMQGGQKMGNLMKKMEKEWKASGYEKEWSTEELKAIVDKENS